MGVLTVMGCDSAWEGLWVIELGEASQIAGDCAEEGDSGWDDSDYYENSTGDDYQIMEVAVEGDWAAISFGHADLSLVGEVDGTSIEAERISGYEYGYGKKGKDDSWLAEYASERSLELDLDGSLISGTLKSIYTETETSWRADGTDIFTYTCTTKWKLDGSRGDSEE
jgi:hypothetical protein